MLYYISSQNLVIVKSNSLFHSFLGQHKRQAELSSSQRHISIRRQQTKQVASRRHKTFSPQLSIIVNKLNQDITNTFSQPKTHLTIMEGHQDRIPDGARSNLNTFPIYLYVPGTDNRTQSVLPEKNILVYIFLYLPTVGFSSPCIQPCWGFYLRLLHPRQVSFLGFWTSPTNSHFLPTIRSNRS